MQNRKNVLRLSIILLTVLLTIVPLRAQVTVGDTEAPHTFSLLELVAKSPVVGGLRLPQLTDAQCEDLKTFFTSGTTSSEDKTAAEGLVVYNIDLHCLFFWSRGEWVSACKEQTCTSTPFIFNTSKTSQRIGELMDALMSVDATGMGTLSYQWYSGIVGDETAPVATAQSGSYTPWFADAGVYDYWCKVSDTCGSVNSSQFTVTVVACGAYIADGVWKKFMCYNLGVTGPSIDPFEPSPDLIGDYYCWGSPTPAGNRYGFIGLGRGTYDPLNYYGSETYTTREESYTTTIKSPTDPCPDGYRVPNGTESFPLRMVAANTWNLRGPLVDDENCISGVQIGDALFLPAAGILIGEDVDYNPYEPPRQFYALGRDGYYWTTAWESTQMPPDPVILGVFSNKNAINAGTYGASAGITIRCVAE